MKIKHAPILLLLTGALLHSAAFAQSGTIHFVGRIVAPICSGTPTTDSAQTLATSTPSAPTMDTTGCGTSAGLSAPGVPPQSAWMSDHQAPTDSGDMNPVWTITYH